jgi:proline racemase
MLPLTVVHRIRTVDAHVGGQPLRLVVEGAPRVNGKTIGQKQAWLTRHAEPFRRGLVLEPRGHVDMTAALLVDSSFPGAHAALIAMTADAYPSMSGHAVIAATTIALQHGLLFSRDEETAAEMRLTLETGAGLVPVRARVDRRASTPRVDSVAFTNVPAFVHAASHPVKLGTRELRVDIAYGGGFYAIADTEAIGIPLETPRLPDLRRLGREVLRSLDAADVVHPLDPALSGLSGVIFTGAPHDPEAHLRNVTVHGDGAIDRSAGGAGTSAVMAVLDAMGLLPDGQPFVHEGIAGSLLRGRALRRVSIGEREALVTEIEGTAWITGEQTLYFDDDDPFRDGFAL